MTNKPSRCHVCATPYFERNNYFYGKQFTVRDLIQEQSYFNDKRHLVNRMVLGWGVVCGLDVRWEQEKRVFVVDAGMAIDCCGREIIICEPQTVEFKDYDSHCRTVQEYKDVEHKFVLCLEYDECKSEPVHLQPVGCDDKERTEYNRVRDGYKLRIKRWDDACPKQPYDHIACLNRFKHDIGTQEPESHTCETETIHHYLCRKLKKGCPECEGCDCVVLGTIYLKAVDAGNYNPPAGYPPEQQEEGYKQCGYDTTQSIEVRLDTCTDRRFVYSNSLLYDLIYCHHGDLPHIVDFNWRQPVGPNRELEWEQFQELVRGGFRVYFDQEMNSESLNEHTFFLTFFHEDRDSGNLFVKRIPAKHVVSEVYEGCHTALWEPDPIWVHDECDSQRSQLADGCDVEITLRGSRIWDSRGKGLDGAFLANKLPTGNGTQGTEFIDWFRILKRKDRYEDF